LAHLSPGPELPGHSNLSGDYAIALLRAERAADAGREGSRTLLRAGDELLVSRPGGDTQEFRLARPWSENGWVEDYIARVHGRPLGCVVLVTRNAAGQTQHIVANYRPLSTVLHFSRLLGERLADPPYGKHFATTAD
jgi:hypothetical protein